MTSILSHAIYFACRETIFSDPASSSKSGQQSTSNESDSFTVREQESLYFSLLDVTSKNGFSPASFSGGFRDFIISKTTKQILDENLIEFQEGNIPFVLSIPHGGTKKVRGCIPRNRKVETKDNNNNNNNNNNNLVMIPLFADGPDENTLELGQVLEDHFIRLLNDNTKSQDENILLRPYVVKCNIHREYLDLNRPPGRMAYDSLQGATFHKFYHQILLKKYLDKVSRTFDSVLFIDLHGHALVDLEEEAGSAKSKSIANTFFRGTCGGNSFRRFLSSREDSKIRGAASLIGPWSIFGFLNQTKGYPVHPCLDKLLLTQSEVRKECSFGEEMSSMAGGYITQIHAEARNDVVQGMQIETGTEHRRTKEQQERVGKDLAEAIIVFLKTYFYSEMKVAENKFEIRNAEIK